jgi:hypothetical protein
MLDFIDFKLLKDLGRNDTTLFSSSLTLEYMQKKMADSTRTISNELLEQKNFEKTT